MQKKIIAVAVAALASTAAFAQTNVTVYGVVDVQQAFVKSSNGAGDVNQRTVGRLDSHGNYIGFKGVEDLGNGLKAVFVYETAISADEGAGFTGTRDSYIGLAGGFGTVAAGNLTHPLRAFGAKVELVPGAAGFGTMASITGTIAGIKTGADDRAKNAVAYISPSFGGFTGVVAYVNGENKTNETVAATGLNSRQFQVAGQYDNGPLFVGAGYHKVFDNNFANGVILNTGAESDARVFRAVAAYTLPSNTKLTALFDSTKVTGVTAIGAVSEVKRNAFSLGVAQGFGKNTIGFEYAQSMKVKADGVSVADSGKKMGTLVYSYDLSKRTMLHARYSALYNKTDGLPGNQNFYNQAAATPVVAGEGADFSGFSVGLRHSF